MADAERGLADLSEGDRQELEAWLVAFDQQWGVGVLPDRARRLPSSSSWRLPALREMVKIDLERQWALGHRIGLEQYLGDYPELGRPGDVDASLIHVEYEVRRQFGAAVDLDDYARRFPAQVEQLRALIASGRSSLSLRVGSGAGKQPGAAHGAPRSAVGELPEQFGRYRILRRLGAGGMGSVYLAEDTRLKRKVALKVAHVAGPESPQLLERFHREAEAAAKLDHPYLCKVYDVDQIDGVHYLTMEYVEGTTLADYVAGRKDLSQRQVAAIVGKLALALQEAHAKGVVHRDLKPSNVMIKMTGQRAPVIVDFGLAQHAGTSSLRLTQTGQALGTPHYMAVEQVKGELNAIGPACDIYALGVILYELLTGVVPFDGPNPMVVVAQILTTTAVPPSRHRPDTDPRLEAICLKAMSRQIGDRHATMAELAAALTDYLKSPTSSSAATPARPPVSPTAPAAAAPPPRQGSDTLMAQFFENLAAEPIVELRPRSRPGASAEAVPVRSPDPHGEPPRPGRLRTAVGGVLVLLVVLLAAGVLIIRTRHGEIIFEGLPEDAEVYIDGERTSVAWTGAERAAGSATRPGNHEVEVRKKGFRPFEQNNVPVERGRRTRVHVRLSAIAPASAVPPRPSATAGAQGAPAPLTPLGAEEPTDRRTANVPDDAAPFGKSRYKLYPGNVTWKEAKRKCEAMGGHLVTVNGPEENGFVRSLLLKDHLDYAWLGASDEVVEGNWVWVDGMPLRFNRWDVGARQPNSVSQGVPEHFAAMNTQGLWWDIADDGFSKLLKPGGTQPEAGYVCEWDQSPPSTGGALVNGGADGPSPVRPKNVPEDAVRLGTSWYKLYVGSITWSEAKRKCEERGGHLVIIHGEEENRLIHSMMLGSHLDLVLLGATDEAVAGNWVWVDGTPVRFNRWDSQQDQPNHRLGNGIIENYAGMRPNNLWWDVQDDQTVYDPERFKVGYVCEWDQNPRPTDRTIVKSGPDGTGVQRPKEAPVDAVRFGTSWYRLYPGDVNWKDARRKCEEMGGQLVVVDGPEENGFVRSLLMKDQLDFGWIGATDEMVEGSWVWVNGMPMRFNHWELGSRQPNGAAHGIPEHYAAMKSNGLWWDVAADRSEDGYYPGKDQKFGYVCEWDPNPQSTVRTLVRAGTSPTGQPRPGNVPVDAVWFGTSWYKLYRGDFTWKEAKRNCEERGGQLVIINDEEENRLIHSMMLGNQRDFVLLGATDEAAAGGWVWVDGTPMRFSRWDIWQNQPNHVLGSGLIENYAAMNNRGFWWDIPDDGLTRTHQPEGFKAGYICEWVRDVPSNGEPKPTAGSQGGPAARAPAPAATPGQPAGRLRDWFSVIGPGSWELQGDEVVQTLQEPDARGERWFYVLFGDQGWSNYNLTLELNSVGVPEAVGVLFHWLSKEHHLALNMGANDIEGTELRAWFGDRGGRKQTVYRTLGPESEEWHHVRIEVRGEAVRGYLDGALVFADTDPRFTRGAIGLACSRTAVRFRSIRVSAPDGKILWGGPPAEPPPNR